MPPTPRVDDAGRHLVGAEPLQRAGERFRRALHVGLDEHRQLLGRALADALDHLLEGAAAARGAGELGLRGRDWRGSRRSRAHAPRSRRRGTRRPPAACRRDPGSRPAPPGRRSRTALPRSSISARTRPHSAPATTMSPTLSVPRWTSTVATGPRPWSSCASITTPSAGRSGIGLELEHLGLQQRWPPRACRGSSSSSPTTSIDWTSPPSSSTCDLVAAAARCVTRARVGAGLVDLVDRDDHRHARRLGVGDRLLGLRHDAVVGRHHQDDDVGHLGAAGAHGGEGLVARRVEEGDLLARRQGRPDRRRYAG